MANMKMTATASKQGFTLVELIVVITILAILGTIGFISLQGYSAQSRDSKRTSDLRSLSTAVTTKSTEGLSLLSFVGTTQSNLVTTSGTLGLAGTGSTGVITATGASQNYSAGTPNNTVLGINPANFNDPNTNAAYRIGATTLAGGSFQIAARLEASGTATAEVTGNYNSRVTTSTTSGTGSATSDLVTIVSSGAGLFKKGDWISGTGLAAGTQILTVSGDGLTLKLNKNATATSITGIAISVNEMTGLIGTTGGAAIADNQTTNLPY